jgi:hypothetical protein
MRQLSIEQAGASTPLTRIDLPLAGLPPGQYSVEIVAKSPAGNARDTVKFRVAD